MAGDIKIPGTQAPAQSYTDQVMNMTKDLGLSEKGVELVNKACEILGRSNVTVTNKTETAGDVGKPTGATGLPELDNPDSKMNRKELLEKLIAYLQLDNEKRQTEMAKDRIETNKASLELEHKNRKEKINKSLEEMDKAEKAAKASRIFGWLGAIIAVVAAVIVTIATGGVAAGFAIAGAVVAVASLVANETGLTEKLIDELAKSFEKSGMSTNDAKFKAALIVNLSVMAVGLICSGGSMVGGIVSAGKSVSDMLRLAQTIMTITNTVVGAGGLVSGGVNTAFQFLSENAKADVSETEKMLQELQRRLQESEEELQKLIDEIEANLGDLAELLNSATNTETEIANNIGEMA